jgi:hypothetical protein
MEHTDLRSKFENDEIGFEAVFQKLAEWGHCPSLIHDDGGKWAMCFEGYQDLPMGRRCESTSATFIVQKEMWKGSIRDAVLAGLRTLG